MRIAAQLYTIRKLLPEGLGAAVARLREIGYEAVEVSGVEPGVTIGMPACAAHIGLGEIEQAAARCKAWGCRYAVIPSLPAEDCSPEGFRRFAARAEKIATRLRNDGIELAYHNHDFEMPIGLELLFTGGLKAELDTFWLRHGGADAVAWIRRLAGRVPLVHLKDMAAGGGQTEVGEGILDWPAILSACQEAGTEWLIVEQDETERDPLDSLEISYRNLRRLLGPSP